jgi:DNA-binding Lrp family transcriptional regulator
MPVAFVLVNVEVGKTRDILDALKKIKGVAEAYTVAGPYDIVVKLQADKFDKVAEGVTKNLHKIPGITNTVTLFAFE